MKNAKGMNVWLVIPAIALLLACSKTSFGAEPRVLVLGGKLAPAIAAWRAAGIQVETAAMKDGQDSAALAARCNVIVLVPEKVPATVQAAIEEFVRGGGGLLIDASCPRREWCGTTLDMLSPTVALDERATRLGRIQSFAPDCPLADIPLADFPRLASLQNVSLPNRGQVEMLNDLSARYFSKPPWHTDWQEWAFCSELQSFAVLSVARYGAGRTAAWGASSLADPNLSKWQRYPEMCKRIVGWLAGDGAAKPAAMTPVSIIGYEPPKWWAGPLANGLRGMDQKIGLDSFLLPPEAFAEAGYAATFGGDAAIKILFGKQADADPGNAKIVLRLPMLDAPVENKPFDPAALKVVSSVKQATLLNRDGSTADVNLPHRLPPLAAPMPKLDAQDDPPAVDLPAKWRIAMTNDSDAENDLAEGWQRKDYNDAQWQEGELKPVASTLFGKEAGLDGAIWYRGTINVKPDALAANAALAIEAKVSKGWVAAYVDGKEAALEPQRIVLPLRSIGAGSHLLAVRTYGEMRSNYGLTSVKAVRLPLLWRPDPEHVGWAEGWAKAETDESKWQPVSYSFGKDPAGRVALEGWLRFGVQVPKDSAPSAMVLDLNLKVESKVFVNGKEIDRRGLERASRYVVPGDAFAAGRNVVVVWARYLGHESHGIGVEILPAEPAVFRATVQSERDGLGLRARLQYNEQPYYRLPLAVSMRVNGHAVGGNAGQGGQTIFVYAPHALKAGANEVEISMTRAAEKPCELAALDVVETPDEMTRILPGWAQCPREKAPERWFDPATDDSAWRPAGTVYAHDYVKTWQNLVVADIGNPGYVYRTHLVLRPEELRQDLTLFVKGPAIKMIFVNGQPVRPLDTFYYSLNAALKPGDNVIAFAPDASTYRGLDMPVPLATREHYVFMPELRTDRAPLVPEEPSLGAFRLNRTFPVSRIEKQPDGLPLFSWPNGDAAIAVRKAGDRVEIAAAPGVFDDLLPGPNLATRAMQGGATTTVEYDYAVRQQADGLCGDRIEQLLPAILAWAEGQAAHIGEFDVAEHAAHVTVRAAPRDFTGELFWRILDFEGEMLASGTTPVKAGPRGDASITITLPDPSDPSLPDGARLGRAVRLRAALLSADTRQPVAFIERQVQPDPPGEVVLRFDDKLARLNESTGAAARRVLHESIDQLSEGFVYLPGETVTIRAVANSRRALAQRASLTVRATPAVSGKPVERTVDLNLLPWQQAVVAVTLGPEQTRAEQPWQVAAELQIGGNAISRSVASFVVAQPRGQLEDLAKVNAQGHGAGGYMWQMSPHAWPIEHLRGTDAQRPQPEGPWWLSCRLSGDGNWTIAQGIHREDQGGLLWGPFYDQVRGEVMDSYGWFPNGQPIRQWWAPFATRELLRRNGRLASVFAMSDWWQYDAGYPPEHYATLQMFNEWLAANKGRRVAGKLLDGTPIAAATMAEMRKTIDAEYREVFKYFIAEGLAHSAQFTGRQLDAVAPGTLQLGQGCYAATLPGTLGGTAIGPTWAAWERTGFLDADNHPFAGDWQYALESVVFRSLGVNNYLRTHWEAPMRYHRTMDTDRHMVPLSAAQWTRRLLDCRWQTVPDEAGRFQRAFNVTHDEKLDGESELLPEGSRTNIGGGRLPYHWLIKDRLAALAMTIAPARPLNPLLVVGECDLDWFRYYSLLGQLRNAGLTFGGAVSIANLDKLKNDQIPGLVWIAAPEADAAALAAITKKIEAGVPVLLVGNAPAEAGGRPDSGLRGLLGLAFNDAPIEQTPKPQELVAERCKAWPEAQGVDQLPAASPQPTYIEVAGGGTETVVRRDGRVALGQNMQKGRRVVFYGVAPRPENRDPAVQQMAVRAFRELMRPAVQWSTGSAGYAFDGLDGRCYIVVLNLQMRPATHTVTVNRKDITPAWRAADMLSGEGLRLQKAAGGGLEVSVRLDGASGTVLTMINDQ